MRCHHETSFTARSTWPDVLSANVTLEFIGTVGEAGDLHMLLCSIVVRSHDRGGSIFEH